MCCDNQKEDGALPPQVKPDEAPSPAPANTPQAPAPAPATAAPGGIPPPAQYGIPRDAAPPPQAPEPEQTPRTGKAKDFHASFWPMLLLPHLILCCIAAFGFDGIEYYVAAMLAHSWVLVLALLVGLCFKFVFRAKNDYLAKGFLWGGIIALAVPIIGMLLLFGACFLSLAAGF